LLDTVLDDVLLNMAKMEVYAIFVVGVAEGAVALVVDAVVVSGVGLGVSVEADVVEVAVMVVAVAAFVDFVVDFVVSAGDERHHCQRVQSY